MAEMYDDPEHIKKHFNEDFLSEYLREAQRVEMIEMTYSPT